MWCWCARGGDNCARVTSDARPVSLRGILAEGGPMQQDCVVVGASFAGLACATALAGAGARVTVLERKHDPGVKLHTTGILVRDLVEQLPLLDGLPPEMARRVNGVRLYAPNMSSVDLAAPGYYFLATDTRRLMRWLAGRAEQAGARLWWAAAFAGAAYAPGRSAPGQRPGRTGGRAPGAAGRRCGRDGFAGHRRRDPFGAEARACDRTRHRGLPERPPCRSRGGTASHLPEVSRQAPAAIPLRPFSERSRLQ